MYFPIGRDDGFQVVYLVFSSRMHSHPVICELLHIGHRRSPDSLIFVFISIENLQLLGYVHDIPSKAEVGIQHSLFLVGIANFGDLSGM